MGIKNSSFLIVITVSSFFLASLSSGSPSSRHAILSGGWWELLQASVGVSAMHMQLLHNNKVMIFDRTDAGPSNHSLPDGKCILTAKSNIDCTAHSVLYDVVYNTFRPLTVHFDTWCSSGSLMADGTLVQTGGYGLGERAVRTFTPCDDHLSCDWVESPGRLAFRRWYATNQILPDGRMIIIGGRRAFTYEFYPKNVAARSSSLNSSFYLRFLAETRDVGEENNLYPFVHLLPDGNLFIFANKRSILFDYLKNRVIKEFPVIPGDDKRNYPSTGSSVMLPLRLNGRNKTEVEVLICGGAPAGAFNKSDKAKPKVFVEASRTCGRLKVTDPRPKWVMELMPTPRVMSDMLLLPTGEVIIINGAANGTAGWEDAANPVLSPVLYIPDESPKRRFVVLNPTTIPRMYHSTALLLPDGRILVGGSNPHRMYNFTAHPFPTDLSLEAYHPHYLDPGYAGLRPWVLETELSRTVTYGRIFSVTFEVPMYRADRGVSVRLVAPSFSTHSVALNQRMVVLHVLGVEQLSVFAHSAVVDGPTNATVAPPGYYMMFVVHSGIPSEAVWVKVTP